MEKQENIEQRKHKRFQAQDNTFAVIYNHGEKIAQILDISMGGLALKYHSDTEWSKGMSKMDAFLVGNDVALKKIPLKFITDIKMDKDITSSTIKMRRRCMKFSDLNFIHLMQLKDFIQNYTIQEV